MVPLRRSRNKTTVSAATASQNDLRVGNKKMSMKTPLLLSLMFVSAPAVAASGSAPAVVSSTTTSWKPPGIAPPLRLQRAPGAPRVDTVTASVSQSVPAGPNGSGEDKELGPGWYGVANAFSAHLDGDPKLARRRLKLLVEESPDHARGHVSLGMALQTRVRAGRPAEAIEHFERALELRPEWSTVEAHLSKMRRNG